MHVEIPNQYNQSAVCLSVGTMSSIHGGGFFHTSIHHCWLFFLLIHHHWLFHLLFFLLLFFLFLQGCDVLTDNAKEVGEESINAACNVKSDDNFLLSGCFDESNTVITCGHGILLVQEHEVACTPDSDKGDTNDNQNASNSHVGSV